MGDSKRVLDEVTVPDSPLLRIMQPAELQTSMDPSAAVTEMLLP